MTDAFSLAAQLVTGWLVADFLSGIIHWIEDRVLWVGMLLISKSVVEPNRLHHRDPDAFLAQSIGARNSTAWAAVPGVAPRGRAHVCTPVPYAHPICRLLLETTN